MGETFPDDIFRLAYILYKVSSIYVNGKAEPGSRSVSQLKKSILNPATTSNYICRFGAPGNSGNDFQLNSVTQDLLEIACVEASLPGSSLATIDIDNTYHGVSEKIAYRRIYDDRADFTFIVDRNYFAIKYFEAWISRIVSEGPDRINETYSHRAKYAEDYRTDNLYITKFEKDYLNKDAPTLTYRFIGAYPISIVSMPISYDQSQLLKCTVSFTYLRYVVNPEGEGIEATAAVLQNTDDAKNPSYPLPDLGSLTEEYYNNFGDNTQNATNSADFFDGSNTGPFGEGQA